MVPQPHPAPLAYDGDRLCSRDDLLDGITRPDTAVVEIPPGWGALGRHRVVNAPTVEAPDAVRPTKGKDRQTTGDNHAGEPEPPVLPKLPHPVPSPHAQHRSVARPAS